MSSTFFYIILAVLIFDYLLERLLDYLNSTYWSDALPAELSGIYDQEKYRKSMAYEKQKQRFSLVVSSLTFFAMMAVLISGAFGWMDQTLRHYTGNPIILAILFFGVWDWFLHWFPSPLISIIHS